MLLNMSVQESEEVKDLFVRKSKLFPRIKQNKHVWSVCLSPTWCWHFCIFLAFYSEHPWGLLGLRFSLLQGKSADDTSVKGWLKLIWENIYSSPFLEGRLCQSPGLDIALSRMARRPSRLALGVWHQEMRFQVFYLVPPQCKENFFFVPLCLKNGIQTSAHSGACLQRRKVSPLCICTMVMDALHVFCYCMCFIYCLI